MKIIITQTQLKNIIDNRDDKHLVKVESLGVAQLREELRNRKMDSKGSKADLVQRLKQTLGRGVRVCLIFVKITIVHIHNYVCNKLSF